MNIGVDLGNYATKTSKGIIFPSRIAHGHNELNKNDIKVTYEGKDYTVGTGRLELGTNRINSKLYELCLLTSIGKSFTDLNINTNIIVGLPPSLFQSDLKNELKNILNSIETKEIIINGIKKYITINKSDVFSESAIVFNSPSDYKNSKTLVVDIGGGSTDISQFNGLNSVKQTTTKYGMLTLCESMKQVFNAKEKANYTADMIEDLINRDTEIIRGEKKNIAYLKDVILDHVSEICNVITQNFDTESSQILLIGGGAEKLISYFKQQYKNAELVPNGQLANAMTYEAVGEMLWGEK